MSAPGNPHSLVKPRSLLPLYGLLAAASGGLLVFKVNKVPVAGRQEPALVELAKRIERQLPRGWEVSYELASEDGNAWINVTRRRTMVRLASLPNSSPFDKPVYKELSFAYTVVPYLSVADYRRRRDENLHLQKAAHALDDELSRTLRSTGKGSDFEATTEAEKKKVARWKHLGRSFHELPEYYYRDIGLTWVWPPRTRDPAAFVEEPVIQKECESVLRMVTGLLSKYEP